MVISWLEERVNELWFVKYFKSEFGGRWLLYIEGAKGRVETKVILELLAL